MPKRSPKSDIAAVLIVRNEARCVVRCLDSVRRWVDRVVVLDTGSTDDTVTLARRCGAQVHGMVWPDDFSAARNAALDLADADWNLVIDADEWLVAGGEGLRAWCDGPPRLGVTCIESDFDAPGGGDGSDRSWVTRLLPRGVRYAGRVHEQVVSDLPRDRTALRYAHDGYREVRLAGKIARNGPLLLRELGEHPDDPYILFQLGKDAELQGDHAAAGARYTTAYARTDNRANWRHELVVRMLHCLGRSGQVDVALALAQEHLTQWPDSPDLWFVLGNLLLERAMADPAQAIAHWLPLARSAWERCLAIGERPDLEGSVRGRGSHLARHNLDVLTAQMASLRGS
ncbi:MAG: glycosyltransferase [Pseudomonadota bacterium]